MVKKVFGVLCGIAVFVYIIMFFASQCNPVLLVLAAFFGWISFLLLRKKKAATGAPPGVPTSERVDAYINVKGTVYRTDGAPIENREVAYLAESGLREALAHEADNPKFHRTARDQELTTLFFTRYGEVSARKADAFEELERQAYQTDDVDEKIELLQAALAKYQEVKAWHYNKSKGAMLWFQDTWEYMHNSKRPCFSWDSDAHEYLAALIYERDFITPGILTAIQEGVLQKDLFLQFPPDKKSSVRACIKRMETAGFITKTKKGSTYLLGGPI